MNARSKTVFAPTERVASSVPLASWIGGKRLLSRRICALLAMTPHNAYCEPFVGMGGVFLRRAVAPPVEVINDLSGDVVNLFRVVQRWPQLLTGELGWWPAMRAEFDRIRTSRDDGLLDIERAARFLYLQTLSFGGKVVGRSFGAGPSQPRNFHDRRVRRRIERLHERLAGVVIENLGWANFLDRYDRSGTLFYLDPPYWESECDYGAGIFSREDFYRISEILKSIKGRFLMSINDRPEIRDMFSWANIRLVQTSYSLSRNGVRKGVGELLVARGVDLGSAEGKDIF